MALDISDLIEHSESAVALTTHLELARRRLVVANVVWTYTWVDESLALLLAHYYFPGRSFVALWRTKKFRRFNYFILEKLSLLEKLDHVRDIRPMTKDVVVFIQRLNGLRNALAHTFFPENLKGRRTDWRGKDVFSIEGFRSFEADADVAREYFVPESPGVNVRGLYRPKAIREDEG